jgi:hypothetical protein
MEKIKANKINYHCVLHINWSQLSKSDQRQAHRIVSGGKYKQHRQTECLTSALDFDINNNQYMTSLADVHIWFHQCARHALAMHLKRTDQLIPLLQCHLKETLENDINHTSQEEEEVNHPLLTNINNTDVRVTLISFYGKQSLFMG